MPRPSTVISPVTRVHALMMSRDSAIKAGQTRAQRQTTTSDSVSSGSFLVRKKFGSLYPLCFNALCVLFFFFFLEQIVVFAKQPLI